MPLRPPAVIGYFDASQGAGGTTRYLLDLLSCLDRNRFRPVLFALGPAPWHQKARGHGAQVITLSSSEVGEIVPPGADPAPPSPAQRGRRLPAGPAWTVGLARETAALVRLFRTRQMDLLHTNNTGAEPAPIAARLAGVPRILGTWHVDSTYDLTGERAGLRYRLLERLSMASLHGAIAVSEATRRDWVARCRLSRGAQRRVTVIHNGIDPGRLSRRRTGAQARADIGLPGGGLLIGSVGRLEAAKGYEFLIRAMPEILRAEPSAYLALAGTGPLAGELERLAQQLGLSDRVRFLGFVDPVARALEAFDLYAQPSLCEALGYAALEAEAMGLPVVASRVGGLPEAVAEGRSGLLVPPRDSAALATAIVTLSRASPMRTKMERHGPILVRENFSLEQMAARTVAVYEQMLPRPNLARLSLAHMGRKDVLQAEMAEERA